jgi:hypothetical protein
MAGTICGAVAIGVERWWFAYPLILGGILASTWLALFSARKIRVCQKCL